MDTDTFAACHCLPENTSIQLTSIFGLTLSLYPMNCTRLHHLNDRGTAGCRWRGDVWEADQCDANHWHQERGSHAGLLLLQNGHVFCHKQLGLNRFLNDRWSNSKDPNCEFARFFFFRWPRGRSSTWWLQSWTWAMPNSMCLGFSDSDFLLVDGGWKFFTGRPKAPPNNSEGSMVMKECEANVTVAEKLLGIKTGVPELQGGQNETSGGKRFGWKDGWTCSCYKKSQLFRC